MREDRLDAKFCKIPKSREFHDGQPQSARNCGTVTYQTRNVEEKVERTSKPPKYPQKFEPSNLKKAEPALHDTNPHAARMV